MIDRSKEEFVIAGGDAIDEINNLTATFIVPGAGRFGRDKHVSVDEATAAKVTYTTNGQTIRDREVTVAEAIALIEKAQEQTYAASQRAEEKYTQDMAAMAAVQQKVQNLTCLVCGGTNFDKQISREDSRMGYTTFRMDMRICVRCGFVMQFSQGQSWFVPG